MTINARYTVVPFEAEVTEGGGTKYMVIDTTRTARQGRVVYNEASGGHLFTRDKATAAGWAETLNQADRLGTADYQIAMDQLHDIDPVLIASIAQKPIEELNTMMFGAWADEVKTAVLEELHAIALYAWPSHVFYVHSADVYDNDELGEFIVKISKAIAERRPVANDPMRNDRWYAARERQVQVYRDELHARALEMPCDCHVCVQRRLSGTLDATSAGCSCGYVWSGDLCRWIAPAELAMTAVHEEALQVDALITLAMASAVDNTDPEIGSVRDVIMDAIERYEYQTGNALTGDVITAATAEVTARLA